MQDRQGNTGEVMDDETEKTYAGMPRRSFALGAGGAAVLLAMGGLKAVPAQAQVRPPGGQDEDQLISACIRCERCVEACPTAALSLAADATAEGTILGKAVIIKDWCLAWDKNNGCKFCYDACPYEAIELDEFGRPVVIAERCNGCGACQNSCVALLCPVGALTTMLASKTVLPRAAFSLVLAVIAIVILGRAFCAWICPVPVWGKLRTLFKRQPSADEVAGDEGAGQAAGSGKAANVDAPLSAKEAKMLKTACGGSCHAVDAPPNSRHLVLGGTLLSAAIFGFSRSA